jgi:hypothetical protein
MIQQGGGAMSMFGDESWAPVTACTLPTAEQPLRVAEFDALFEAGLQRIERRAPGWLRMWLADGLEARVRALIARETACCSFFDFRLTAAAGEVLLDVRVPASRTEVLDGIARRAGNALPDRT